MFDEDFEETDEDEAQREALGGEAAVLRDERHAREVIILRNLIIKISRDL